MSEIVNVTITAPSATFLVRLTRELVEAGLAASGNVTEQVQSIYAWQGEVHDANEAVVSLRSQARHVPEIIRVTQAQHPYEVPHVVAMPIVAANPSYQQWVVEATGGAEE